MNAAVMSVVEFGVEKVNLLRNGEMEVLMRLDYRGSNPFGGYSWYRPTVEGFVTVYEDDEEEDALEAAYQQFKNQARSHQPSHDEGSEQ